MQEAPDNFEDDELEKIAKTLVHASESEKKTFLRLLRAFMARTTIEDTTQLHIRSTDTTDNVRNRITRLRTQLSGTVLFIPGRGECEFEIPQRTPYHLQMAKTLNRSLLWNAHVHSPSDVIIHSYERLFFRYQQSVYVRKLSVNQSDDDGKKEIATLLKCDPKDLAPTMHYVSSGEVNAAIALQNFFARQAHKPAVLSTGNQVNEQEGNRILLGSARLDVSEMASYPHEKFRIVQEGIRTPKKILADKDGQFGRRIVHVVMSRRATGGVVETVFEGSHGRAIEGLSKALIAEESSLCQSLVAALRKDAPRLPPYFQAIFKLEVVFAPDLSVKAAAPIEVVAVEFYSLNSAAASHS
jgi:hypothetical protein